MGSCPLNRNRIPGPLKWKRRILTTGPPGKFFPPLISLAAKLSLPSSHCSSGYSSCMCYVLHAKSLQSCLTLCDSMGCRLPGSSVHEILLVRILEWVVMPSSMESSQRRDQTPISCLLHWQAGSLPLVPPVLGIIEAKPRSGFRMK